MSSQQVLCIRAGAFSECRECPHGVIHDAEIVKTPFILHFPIGISLCNIYHECKYSHVYVCCSIFEADNAKDF